MKVAAAIFFILLTYAHAAQLTEQPVAQPLSLFRDGQQPWIGYALFFFLLVIGALNLRAHVRAARIGDMIVSGFALFLLSIVAATPSDSGLHLMCSFILLVLLFAYYFACLYRAQSFLLIAHLTAPVGLIMATQFHSYGIWQKALISYFVLVVVIHHHMIARETQPTSRLSDKKSRNLISSRRRRKVYLLESESAWQRKPAERSKTRSIILST